MRLLHYSSEAESLPHSLLSGGADSSIAIWDLEAATANEDRTLTHRPLGYASRTSTAHNFGITHLSFYPFDSLAFLSSSYDHSLKIYSSEMLTASASFDLASVVFSHALSPVASHLLVACATQHPAVRLVDLRSGSSTHSLAGHAGAVLTVSWHPQCEHLLASGATDGTVRLWDIRRSASALGALDMDDSVGVTGHNGIGTGARRGRAHAGAVNGILWTGDARHLLSAGHDERVRVWSTSTGANTLANFGPAIKNDHLSTLLPVLAPSSLTAPRTEILFYPNPREVLMYEALDGALLKRLRAPGGGGGATASRVTLAAGAGRRNVRNRTTSLAWRALDVELYSAHADGAIRCWRPRTREDAAVAEEEDRAERGGGVGEERERKRKRRELDEIVRGLTEKRVTFGGGVR
ncbi:hypothetical protein LTR28_005434 [Elasticomyces elasticus]|nr:hypothetical protein LTR28_005434 [Elasticomyces elasticus]